MKMYLSEIKSLRTKEDGEKLQQQCTGTEQDSGMSMDSEYCQQEPRQSIRIMSLSQISQWNSKKWNNLMTVGIPQWFCLMQNPMDIARKCGGLSDVILLMGGELNEKTDQVEEESCSQSAMIRGKNSNSDCEKRNYMELTQKNGLAESIMCAITNYTNTLKSSENTHMENEFQEKHCVCHERKQNTSSMDICPGMEETIEKKQHQPVQHSFLACALLHSDLENLFQLFTNTRRDEKCVIQGRECRQRDTYTFRISSKSVKGHYRARYVCRELYQPTESDDFGTVYNISVEEDNSYVANGAIVHNCQDISVAGKQAGFQGNRSSLFFRVMYLVGQLKEEDKPTYLFIENVKNLLSVNGGWDFARLLIEMEQWGYDAEWQVLNSKDFGVPQNRERCFIIGHLRGKSTAKVFPIEGADGKNSIQIIAHKNGYRRNTQVFGSDGITEALDTGQGGGRGHHVALPCFIDLCYQGSQMTDTARCLKARYYKGVANHAGQDSGIAIKVIGEVNSSQDGKVLGIDGITKCHSAGHNNNPKIAIPVLTPDRAEKRQNGRRFKEDGEPMFTLTSQDRHGVAIDPLGVLRNVRAEYGKEVADTLDTSCNQGIFVQVSEELTVYAVWYEKYQCYIAIRKLTPRECFRLQGWSDDYFEKAQFVNSDSQLYKQAGNGVTVTVVEAISRKMNVNLN